MKKTLLICAFTLVLFIPGFAGDDDGTTHSGGRTCPENQVCRTAPAEHPADNDSIYKYILTLIEIVF